MLRLPHLADQFAMGLRDFHLTFGRLSDAGGLQRLGVIAIEAVKALILVQFRLQPFAIPHIACDQLVLPFAIPGEIHDGVCLHGLLHTLLITLVLLFENVQLFHPHLRGPQIPLRLAHRVGGIVSPLGFPPCTVRFGKLRFGLCDQRLRVASHGFQRAIESCHDLIGAVGWLVDVAGLV